MGVSGCKVNRIRLLSLILAILLTFSAFPVFAAGEEAVWDDPTEETSADWQPEETQGDAAQWEEATEETEDWSTESISEEAGPLARFFPDYTLEDYADVMYASGTILDNGCSVVCVLPPWQPI